MNQPIDPAILAQVLALGGMDDKQALLKQQMAQAEALRRPSGVRHSTGIGGGLGAMADGLRGLAGGHQAFTAEQQQQALLGEQAAARKAYMGLKGDPREIGGLGIASGDPALGEHGRALIGGADKADASKGQALRDLMAKQAAAAKEAAERAEWNRRNAITSKQADKRAQIVAGQKQDAATRGTTVPGMEIEPGAAPTADDAKKIKASLASAQRMKNYIAELRGLHAKHGTEYGGPVGNRMQALTQQIRLEAKNIGELGALSGPDQGIIENIAQADPGSLWANAKGAVGVDSTQDSLGGLERWVDDTLSGNMAAYGYRKKGEAPAVKGGLTPEEAAELAALEAELGGAK